MPRAAATVPAVSLDLLAGLAGELIGLTITRLYIGRLRPLPRGSSVHIDSPDFPLVVTSPPAGPATRQVVPFVIFRPRELTRRRSAQSDLHDALPARHQDHHADIESRAQAVDTRARASRRARGHGCDRRADTRSTWRCSRLPPLVQQLRPGLSHCWFGTWSHRSRLSSSKYDGAILAAYGHLSTGEPQNLAASCQRHT